ncbi:conserved fungal protein [Colletotrichum tofieldiae]|nr:conserved fungal protein [Colletotrichum tofieldiae]
MVLPETSPLDAEQIKALFNILTHFETYHEIEEFKKPETVSNYGYPFAQSAGAGAGPGVTYASESSAPLLQSLFTRFVLKLPGVSTFAPEFWNVQVQGILTNLAEADLSESYDKGALGIRKTLATASSTVIETYSLESARDLAHAWDDAMHDLVYEDLCDDLLDHLAETDDFDSHSP